MHTGREGGRGMEGGGREVRGKGGKGGREAGRKGGREEGSEIK